MVVTITSPFAGRDRDINNKLAQAFMLWFSKHSWEWSGNKHLHECSGIDFPKERAGEDRRVGSECESTSRAWGAWHSGSQFSLGQNGPNTSHLNGQEQMKGPVKMFIMSFLKAQKIDTVLLFCLL